jgi:putative transposase
VEVVTAALTGLSVGVSAGRWEDPLPAPLASGVRVLAGQCGVELDPYRATAQIVSAVTDAVSKEVQAWQNRPLEAVHGIVYLDALRAKIGDEEMVRNKAAEFVIRIGCMVQRGSVGLWIGQREDAKF